MRCVDCDRVVLERENPWVRIDGWERKREQGGTNHVALRKPKGELMCPECMMLRQNHVLPGQQVLA